MTRLQNSKKQLSEALVELESVVFQVSKAFDQSNVSATPSETEEQNVARVDRAALIDEVSIIEAKLNEVIGIIAKIEADTVGSHTPEARAINDGDTQ